MLSNHYARKRLAEIDARLAELEEIAKALPEGKLNISTSYGLARYYQVIGSRDSKNYVRNYLDASEHDVAVELAKKEFVLNEIDELTFEKKSLERLIVIQDKAEGQSLRRKASLKNEAFTNLLSEGISAHAGALSWSKMPYASSAPNPEGRKIRAMDGTLVRSKSESEIVSLLVKYNLPYRYECDLVFNGRTIGCPDFTIMHPSTRKIIIWEHFGLLDDIYYVRRNIHKIQSYIEAGYLPMINLIYTTETSSNPFDITLADSLIRQFFLQ